MTKKTVPASPSDLCVIDSREHPRGEQPKAGLLDCPHGDESPAKGKRREMVDPTTCDRLYTHEDLEFMKAMDQYKRDNRRPFPTWSEALEVLHSLGYRRVAVPTQMPGNNTDIPRKVEGKQ